METNIFFFNKHNVCINPEVIKINEYVSIKISHYDGVWITGFSFEFRNIFHSSPCIKCKECFSTRIEALKKEINRLIFILKREEEIYKESDIMMIKKSIKDLKEYLFDITHVQLSFF